MGSFFSRGRSRGEWVTKKEKKEDISLPSEEGNQNVYQLVKFERELFLANYIKKREIHFFTFFDPEDPVVKTTHSFLNQCLCMDDNCVLGKISLVQSKGGLTVRAQYTHPEHTHERRFADGKKIPFN